MTKCICVWYWFIFLPYVCPFFKFLCWTINWWRCKQNITWLRQSMRKRKAETVLSDTVGYYHRLKLCCLGIWILCWQITTLIESIATVSNEIYQCLCDKTKHVLFLNSYKKLKLLSSQPFTSYNNEQSEILIFCFQSL